MEKEELGKEGGKILIKKISYDNTLNSNNSNNRIILIITTSKIITITKTIIISKPSWQAFSMFFLCITITSDIVCYLFVPVQVGRRRRRMMIMIIMISE